MWSSRKKGGRKGTTQAFVLSKRKYIDRYCASSSSAPAHWNFQNLSAKRSIATKTEHIKVSATQESETIRKSEHCHDAVTKK
jgi:hypothetical protein